jgi:myo-inositol-1(or 4)-monophosphatase
MHPYLNTAITAARRAGTIIVRNLQQLDTLEIFEKTAHHIVTRVDQAAEKAIIETITRAYPYHSILGEEPGTHPGNDYEWIIDPLDGTLNFIHGFPQFSVSIALRHKGQLEHAVVFDPLSQDLYTASKGSGAQLNNRRIRISKKESLKGALVGVALPIPQSNINQQDVHWFNTLIFEQGTHIRKIGSTALSLAYVACGKLDGFFGRNLQPWDMGAGILLIREAGGFVSDALGENGSLDNGDIVAGTRKVHNEWLTLIQRQLLP